MSKRKHKRPAGRKAKPGCAARTGSATAARFKELFAQSKQSPAYWLEGVIIEIGEYKCELERVPIVTRDIQYELRGVGKCYTIAKREMRRYEKSRNAAHKPSGENR